MPLVTGTTTFVTAEVSSVGANGKSLVANSACSEGVEFAYPPFPSDWVQSACAVSDLAYSVCGLASRPTFTSVATDVVCFRQLAPKTWEVAYLMEKHATGGTTSGTGQYLFALPAEVPNIDTSVAFQTPHTTYCSTNSSGNAETVNHINRMNAHGTVRYATSTALTILPSVYNNRCVRIAVDDTDDPGFISSSFYSASGTTDVTYNFAFQYTSV